MREPSVRAHAITRRSYCRPLNDEETEFETWEQVVDRVIGHQQWLWERAKDDDLDDEELAELEALRHAMYERKVSLAGRTLWLGGTEVSKTTESSMFNCSRTPLHTIHDAVDMIWLLLQGCGVGFKPEPGVLNGFAQEIPKISVIRSDAQTKTGEDHNTETWDYHTWTIRVGDSAEAWAKAFGKLLAGKYRAKELVFDLRPIRPGGYRLKGYGWISSGDAALAKALEEIAHIMNRYAGRLLDKIALLDIGNWMGTILSSRRSAEIAICDFGTEQWEEFAMAKKDYWSTGNEQRSQSNNTLMFWQKPTKLELRGLFQMMLDAGGSEPGFYNGESAKRRAPYFKGTNPCGEQLLGEKSFCSLVETNLPAHNGDFQSLLDNHRLISRANYRQSCVNFRDGILQDAWHELNEYLRLTGPGVTGIVMWEHHRDAEKWRELRRVANDAVNGMADELGLPHSKLVTTVKPSGCRPWNALTTTDSGILTLEELFVNHKDDSEWSDHLGDISVIQDNTNNRITKTYDNGVVPTYRISMNYGAVLDCTADHPWFITDRLVDDAANRWTSINDWVRTCDIKPGDIIKTTLGLYRNSRHSELKGVNKLQVKMRGDSTIVRQPTHMNPDLSWLIGYLWGDGCMSPGRYRLRWTDQNIHNLDKVRRILDSQFGIVAEVHRASGDRDAHVLEVGSKHLWHWLIRNDIFKYYADRLDIIPSPIRSSAKEDIIAFIAGMIDADANVSRNASGVKQIIFAQADEDFTIHFQHVAMSVGLLFGRSLNSKGDNLQCINGEKRMYLMTLASQTVPESGMTLLQHSEKMKRVNRLHPDCKWTWDREGRSHRLGKVKSVDLIGEMETYDIEVDNKHWYYQGAFKSHNTLSKIMDVTEGAHAPLGRYIFNWVVFSKHDPAAKILIDAGYDHMDKPSDPDSYVIKLPFDWGPLDVFTKKTITRRGHDGSEAEVEVEVNLESAVDQLERYRLLMNNYVDHNCSVTISYDPSEVGDIIDWLDEHWDEYVGVSWLLRADPTKSAADLGFPYLPQEVVTAATYHEYVARLKPVDLGTGGSMETPLDDECAGGACPVR